MKVMITMNMPNSSGMPLHKLIADIKAESIEDVYEIMCDREFIMVSQFYVNRRPNGETFYDDLGPVIINTYHIAKVQAYVEKDFDEEDRNAPRTFRNQFRR